MDNNTKSCSHSPRPSSSNNPQDPSLTQPAAPTSCPTTIVINSWGDLGYLDLLTSENLVLFIAATKLFFLTRRSRVMHQKANMMNRAIAKHLFYPTIRPLFRPGALEPTTPEGKEKLGKLKHCLRALWSEYALDFDMERTYRELSTVCESGNEQLKEQMRGLVEGSYGIAMLQDVDSALQRKAGEVQE